MGTCENVIVEGHVVLDEENDSETVLHTNENFGCIHFVPKHGNVVIKIPGNERR
jgi:hypothetical protein